MRMFEPTIIDLVGLIFSSLVNFIVSVTANFYQELVLWLSCLTTSLKNKCEQKRPIFFMDTFIRINGSGCSSPRDLGAGCWMTQ